MNTVETIYNCEWCGTLTTHGDLERTDWYPFCSLEHFDLFASEEAAREAAFDEQRATPRDRERRLEEAE